MQSTQLNAITLELVSLDVRARIISESVIRQ